MPNSMATAKDFEKISNGGSTVRSSSRPMTGDEYI